MPTEEVEGDHLISSQKPRPFFKTLLYSTKEYVFSSRHWPLYACPSSVTIATFLIHRHERPPRCSTRASTRTCPCSSYRYCTYDTLWRELLPPSILASIGSIRPFFPIAAAGMTFRDEVALLRHIYLYKRLLSSILL